MTQRSDMNATAERKWMYGSNVAALVVIGIVILGFVCYLTNRFHSHFDWTSSGMYSLSGSTKNLLKDAQEKKQSYELMCLYRPGTEHYQQVMDLLDEYQRVSPAIKVQDVSDVSLEETQKRIRSLYSAELAPYEKLMTEFDPLSDELGKFFKMEGANIGAAAQQKGVPTSAVREAQELQGLFTKQIPDAISRQQKAVRRDMESTMPDYSKLTSGLKTYMDSMVRQFDIFTNDKQLSDHFEPETAKYFQSAKSRYEAEAKRVKDYDDRLNALQPLKVQDILDSIGEHTVLIIGPTAAKVVQSSDLYKFQQAAAGSNEPNEQFNGEQAISSALLSLERPEKVKVVFVTVSPARLTTPQGSFSEIADTLRENNFDVMEWSPPSQMPNPNAPPPSPEPPAEGAGVVWVVFPPDPPNPQMLMMGMPPPDAMPVVNATRKHMAAGGRVLFLAEANSGLMGSMMPGYPYADLLKEYGVDVQTKYAVVRQIQQETRTGERVDQAIPAVMIDQYANDEITKPLQSLPTVFAPLSSQQGGYQGIPTVVSKAKDVPAGVDVHELMEVKGSDYWGESELGPNSKFDKGTDLASPLSLAVSAIKNKGQAGKEGRVVVIGCKVFAANPFLDDARLVMMGDQPVAVPNYPGNQELFKNSVLWLAGYENMIAVSAKASAALRIGNVPPVTLTAIRLVFFYIGAPLAALLVGGLVWLIRRK